MYNQVNRMLFSGFIVLLLSLSVFISCQSKQDESAENANEISSGNLNSECQAFKSSTEKTIANNDERIKILKEKIEQPGTPNLDKLRQQEINNLEDRNTALRNRIMEYKEDNRRAGYEQFKTEVKKELDELGKEIQELDKN